MKLSRPTSRENVYEALSRLVDELETTEPWRYPTFATGAAHFDGGTPPNDRAVRFYKDALGIIRLQGLIGFTGAGIAANATMFTLPEGYRPYTDGTIGGTGTAHVLSFPAAYWTGAAFAFSIVNVGTDGTVFSGHRAFAVTEGLWLDGVSFRAA